MNRILQTILLFLLFLNTILAQKTDNTSPQYSTNIAPTAHIQLKNGE